MRKFLLLPVMFLTMLATSCSTDDSVKMNEDNSDYSDLKPKSSCTNIMDIEQGVVLVGDDILFYWHDDNLLKVVGRTYISRIEITDKGCVGNTSKTSYPINIFGSQQSLTIQGGVPAPPFPPGSGTDNCFKYRYIVENGLGDPECYSASQWFNFPN